jgi:hypothetical protein
MLAISSQWSSRRDSDLNQRRPSVLCITQQSVCPGEVTRNWCYVVKQVLLLWSSMADDGTLRSGFQLVRRNPHCSDVALGPIRRSQPTSDVWAVWLRRCIGAGVGTLLVCAASVEPAASRHPGGLHTAGEEIPPPGDT